MRHFSTLLSLCLFAGLQVHAASPLGTFVVVGDSLTAGFQNFSLYTSETAPGTPPGGQQHGYAELVAQQAGTDLRNPIISYPGIPPALTIDAAGQINRASGFGMRLNLATQTRNLSVPSYTVANALGREADIVQVLTNPLGANPQDVLELAVLGPPSYCGAKGLPLFKVTLSSVDCATQLNPDTILVSLGSNDALQALIFGAPPTSHDAFLASYDQVMSKLTGTHARMMLANVPDVTSIPYLWSPQQFNAVCGTSITDYVVPNILNPDPAYPIGDICHNFSTRPADLVDAAKAAVVDYNKIIADEAKAANAVVLDVNGLFSDIAANGTNIGNTHLTTAFLGGLFSLDGMHPTNVGYAIMANRAIDTMNSAWHTSIPRVNLQPVLATDPLVPKK